MFWNKLFNRPVRTGLFYAIEYCLARQLWASRLLYFGSRLKALEITAFATFQIHSFPKLIKMKLNEEQMNRVLHPGVKKLADIFERNGHEIRIAGGAVRDLLMGKYPKDLDFATTATPTEMKIMFEKESIRIINFGGEKHGTITAHIDDENFECTTLRIDRSTDGRHAEVEFIKNWELDAGRRDLTINALFLGLDGTVYDYYDGISHLSKKLIVFVGDPEKRIREDYLRILRYFRFYGLIADHPDKHDPKTLDIIMNNCHGLAKISGERIWVEIKKILTRSFGGELMCKMVDCGLGPFIGLSPDFDCQSILKTFSRLKMTDIDPAEVYPATLLAGGFLTENDASEFIQRVKCSNKEKDVLLCIQRQKSELSSFTLKVVLALIVDAVYKDKKSPSHAVFVITELIKFSGQKELLSEISVNCIPKFPIKGGMLIDKVKHRKEISDHINKLFVIWKQSEYSLTADELLERL